MKFILEDTEGLKGFTFTVYDQKEVILLKNILYDAECHINNTYPENAEKTKTLGLVKTLRGALDLF